MKFTLQAVLKEAKRIRRAKQTGILKMGEGRKPKAEGFTADYLDEIDRDAYYEKQRSEGRKAS